VSGPSQVILLSNKGRILIFQTVICLEVPAKCFLGHQKGSLHPNWPKLRIPEVGGEDVNAWGEDNAGGPKVGRTDGDDVTFTSRGTKSEVSSLISGRDNDRYALVNDVDHLWDASQRMRGAGS
jgi:hypothetical protein